MKTWRWMLLGLLILLAVGGILIALWLVPPFVVDLDAAGKKLTAEGRQLAIGAVRQAVLFTAGGLIALVTLAFTWLRDSVARRSAELDRDANFTTRYTEAIKQLGATELPIRLGGVYALERIAADSLRDRQTILDVLSAYLRHTSPMRDSTVNPKLSVDVAAAALVIARISRMSTPTHPVNLARTYLPDAELSGAQLAEARLANAEMRRANLKGSQLANADLSSADLVRVELQSAEAHHAWFFLADLTNADLTNADLSYANLSNVTAVEATFLQTRLIRADLSNANLDSADLEGAVLTAADMSNADVSRADLRGAKLDHAVLARTDLTHSTLIGADLRGADLSGACVVGANFDGANLENATFEDVSYSANTRWPAGFVRPESMILVSD